MSSLASHRWPVAARTLALALFLAALLLPLPARAQAEPPDLATYGEWLRAAFAAAQRSDRLGLEDAAQPLIETESVRLADGDTITVNNGWLESALAAPDPNLPVIADRLGAIIDALAQPPSAAPADARARLEAILSRPPFADEQPSAASGWWTDFWSWVVRVLEAILRPIGATPPAVSTSIGWGIGIVGALLLLGVITYLLVGLRRNMVADRSASDDPEARLTARTALDQAGDLARSGDHRTAMRYLYLSALLWLDERDLLRYDRALTNREYLERVRDNPALASKLAPIVETFDRVWYGHAPLDDAAFAAYRAQVEALRSEL